MSEEVEKERLRDKQLEEEYKILQGKWDDFDRRTISFKGWIAAGSLAFLLSVNLSGQPTWQETAKLCFAIVVILSVWFLEAIWKSWHHAYGARIKRIERYFRGEHAAPIVPFQITTSWDQEYKTDRTNYELVLREMATARAAIPYLPLVFCMIIYLLKDPIAGLISYILKLPIC